jgi:hypothetical protein
MTALVALVALLLRLRDPMLVAASGPSAVVRLSRRARTIVRPASGPIVRTTTFRLARVITHSVRRPFWSAIRTT